MKRGAILCLISVFLLSGCGIFRNIDGSPDQEVKNSRSSKTELLKEVENLQAGNKALRETVDLQQAQIKTFEEKDKAHQKAVSEGLARIESLEKEKNGLLEENKMLKAEAAFKEVTAPAAIKEVTLVEPKKPQKTPAAAVKELHIKVLAGNGGLAAARKTSKKLLDLGYRVEKLDWTTTSSYRSDTVYHTKDLEMEARELAERLGKDTVVKPLTWPSIFNVIVATP